MAIAAAGQSGWTRLAWSGLLAAQFRKPDGQRNRSCVASNFLAMRGGITKLLLLGCYCFSKSAAYGKTLHMLMELFLIKQE